MIKAVLFDLDGTLINTNSAVIESFKYTFKKHLGIKIPEEEITKTFGEPLYDVMERYDKENAELMVNIYREYNEKIHDEFAKSFNGVEDALNILKSKGLKLGVVTSKRRDMAERGLNLFNISKYMDIVITPENTKMHKPKGEPALKACELLNICPEESLMVGDSQNDILCGKNAGCYTCLVKYTAVPLEHVMKYKPDYVIENMLEVVDICLNTSEKIS
ncbi:pyrophosphatase PpaX [Clostridium acetireducens DSM 10703]|uniref:Pyrophosphatase PpaX n=1 Tax=Clostridium acetireducens DSM 10703 TaxID=1121290 RepID=A0A1E8F039_9CLOT|nr:pyrophosphatase PpaX [Clostridium acetireducens]OFI06794.1 pyrophosphatase PpaX [Clostridium acetireducens DSM 10703]